MKTVIVAGGKGSRIADIAPDIPKPMIRIQNKPILEHEIECLRRQGYTDLIITISYLGHMIKDYFGDGSRISPVTGRPFGVKIEYFYERTPLGNAGALFKIKDKLTDDFLLLNADTIFDIDFNRMAAYHKSKGGLATLLTHPNNHPYDSGLLISDSHCSVTNWLTKEELRTGWYKNRVNAGLHILNKNILRAVNIKPEIIGTLDATGNNIKVDLDRQILKPLAGSGKLFCYDTPEYVRDMGTPERYKQICKDFCTGKVHSKNLSQKQKAIFLDRDGTINRHVGFLKNIDDFELLPGVSNAIKKMNEAGYLAIVITNQPVIARGEISVAELECIHNKMETLLGRKGAYLDAIYYCPHHPHKGYLGEIAELKIDCCCRKPKPGLLLKAAKEYNIELENSWMVGDGEQDVLAGKNAGCRTALIGNGNFDQDRTVNSLLEFADSLF